MANASQPFPCPLGPKPKNVADLTQRVEKADPICTCPLHMPETYNYKGVCSSHKTVDWKSEHGYPIPRLEGRNYEAIHLSRAAIEYFDRPKEDLNSVQTVALKKLQDALGEGGDLIWRLQDDEPHRSVPGAEIENLLRLWIQVFLFSAPDVKVKWTPNLKEDKNCVGLCTTYDSFPNKSGIQIEPILSEYGNIPKSHQILGILLHEGAHAYFHQFACRHCHTVSHNIGDGGHGRAWQLLTHRIEKKVEEFLGFKQELWRFHSLMADWETLTVLPSRHDLEEWQLTDYSVNEIERRTIWHPMDASELARKYEQTQEALDQRIDMLAKEIEAIEELKRQNNQLKKCLEKAEIAFELVMITMYDSD